MPTTAELNLLRESQITSLDEKQYETYSLFRTQGMDRDEALIEIGVAL